VYIGRAIRISLFAGDNINYASRIYDFLRYCYYDVSVNCSVIEFDWRSALMHVIMSLKCITPVDANHLMQKVAPNGNVD